MKHSTIKYLILTIGSPFFSLFIMLGMLGIGVSMFPTFTTAKVFAQGGTILLPIGDEDQGLKRWSDRAEVGTGQVVSYTTLIDNSASVSPTDKIVLRDVIPNSLSKPSNITSEPQDEDISWLDDTRELTWGRALKTGETVSIHYNAKVLEDPADHKIINKVVMASESNPDIFVSRDTVVTNTTSNGSPGVVYLPIVQRFPVGPSPAIRNGNFEDGRKIWRESISDGRDDALIISRQDGILPAALIPRSGDWVAWLGGFRNVTTTITQTIALNQEQVDFYSYKLKFYYELGSSEECRATGSDDMAYVQIGSQEPWKLPLCMDENIETWTKVLIEVKVAGDVEVQFWATLDGDKNSNWFIDDVSICSDRLNAPVANCQ